MIAADVWLAASKAMVRVAAISCGITIVPASMGGLLDQLHQATCYLYLVVRGYILRRESTRLSNSELTDDADCGGSLQNIDFDHRKF